MTNPTNNHPIEFCLHPLFDSLMELNQESLRRSFPKEMNNSFDDPNSFKTPRLISQLCMETVALLNEANHLLNLGKRKIELIFDFLIHPFLNSIFNEKVKEP